jgi:transcriptional regulator with GAF, ATPase, and Fis domain
MIGRRHGLRETILLADMVAKLPTPVLLFGESGAGKEMLATRIHQNSNRKSGPFVCVNCGGIPETLIDSELFGYEKGAFTGAEGTRKGYFGQADGGTILLDEISELSKAAQAKLLRVLQSQSFHRVGGEHAAMVDVRVIAATNRDLEEMVNSLEFRKDLWYRLNTF